MLSAFIFILCVALGAVAVIALKRPETFAAIGATLKEAELKRFSPKKTLFLFAPTANHPPCRLQRRLLKPAIPSLIRDDIVVMEVYGSDPPRKNGERVDWLDPALLRHAMNADNGFCVVYVDEQGKAVLRSAAPIVAADILDSAGLDLPLTVPVGRKKSAVLKRLRAA